MLITNKTTTRIGALALGIIAANFFSLPLKAQTAQTNTSEADLFKDIKAGENINWSYSSEDETISIQDSLEELGEYNVSDSAEDAGVQLREEDRRWGNRGDAKDYYFEAEIYNY
ncbi:MAG: hypothetical protein ACFCU7_02780 [Pleurocapsa sp.]